MSPETTKVLVIERILAKVLRLGSIVAGVLLAAGIGGMLLTHTSNQTFSKLVHSHPIGI